MQVLLSIRPEYVDRILSGEKRYEYRRRAPKEPVKTVVIYATSPVMQIVGEFEILEIIEDSPKSLWDRTSEHSGVSSEFYDEYFFGREKAYAIRVGAFRRYDQPVEPYEALNNFCAPQSFRYLR